jgi:hypothetical protein
VSKDVAESLDVNAKNTHEPPFGVLEAALMLVSLDRTDLAVLATWRDVLGTGAFPRCHPRGRLFWRTCSGLLADGGCLQRIGVVGRHNCRQPPWAAYAQLSLCRRRARGLR